MDLDVTYRAVRASHVDLDLVDLRRALGDRTQAEMAELLGVTANTWARWERSELQLHPARAHQLQRLHQLVQQYGEGPFWASASTAFAACLTDSVCPTHFRSTDWTPVAHHSVGSPGG